MARLILFIYDLLWNTLVWPCIPILKRHNNFNGTIWQRLGLRMPYIPGTKEVMWLHASSVGEVKAVAGLVKRLKAKRPGLFIMITSMTATGRDIAAKELPCDIVLPFPFDISWVMQRYLKKTNTSILAIVETEIWPNLILKAKKNNTKVVFINARLGKKAFGRYSNLKQLFKFILKDTHVLALSKDDAERFSSLGASYVTCLGNLKLDSIHMADLDIAEVLKKELGVDNRPVFIAGSIREGEEKYVVDAVKHAMGKSTDMLSILAPRHASSSRILARLLDDAGLRWTFKSNHDKDQAKNIDVVIVDTFGELFYLYGASDVAFVGGSLVDLGGQNILEPLAWGIPTMHGPYMENFAWALEVVGAFTIKVSSPGELGRYLVDTLENLDNNRARAMKARDALNESMGITDDYVNALNALLG